MGEIDYRLLLGQPTQTPASESPLDVISRMGQYQDARYQQQRQRSLAELARQTAGNYQDPTAQAYAMGGFGAEAQAHQQAIYEQQQKQQQIQESAARLDKIHRELTYSRIANAKSQEDFDKVAANLPEEYGLKPGDDYAEAVPRFGKSLVSPEYALRWGDRSADQYVPVMNKDGLVQMVNKRDPTDVVDLHQSEKALPTGKGAKVAGAGGAPVAVTPDTAPPWMVSAAQDYHVTHQLPPLGKDVASKKAILALHAQMFGTGGAAGSASDFKADSASLGHATTQADTVRGFIGTFDKNVKMLEEAAAQLQSSNSPFLNRGLRFYQENGEGDPALTRFKMALNTVTSEAGKINSGQTGAGGVPISVLAEMEHNLPPNATPAQVTAALGILRKDSENRLGALEENITNIKARRSGGGGSAPGTGATRDPHQDAADWARTALKADPNNEKAKAVLAKALKEGAK